MPVSIAITGYGTIGCGVLEIISENRELIRKRSGIDINVKYIIDKDITTPRRVPPGGSILAQDYRKALDDPEIDIMVELVGGTGFAATLVSESLRAGKNVVTANKALLAEKGAELFRLAKEYDKTIAFEASVCGGIPIIRTISDAMIGDRIKSVYGIVNGTTNYILTKMSGEGLDFELALKAAQKLGLAEADPTLDINGHDAAHKAAILASISFNTFIDFSKVFFEGISGLELEDIKIAAELGYIIKLIALAKLDPDGTVEVRANPSLVPEENQLSYINDEFNAILIESDFLGSTLYYGRGAGARPTSVSVASDIVDLAKNPLQTSKFNRFNDYKIKDIGDTTSRYYVRFSVIDKPGVLSRISGELSKNNISIASVIQKERKENDFVSLIMTTHQALEKNMTKSLHKIGKMSLAKEKPVMIRILE